MTRLLLAQQLTIAQTHCDGPAGRASGTNCCCGRRCGGRCCGRRSGTRVLTMVPVLQTGRGAFEKPPPPPAEHGNL